MLTDFTVRDREYLTRISEFLTQVSGMSLVPLIALCDQFSSVLLTSPNMAKIRQIWQKKDNQLHIVILQE